MYNFARSGCAGTFESKSKLVMYPEAYRKLLVPILIELAELSDACLLQADASCLTKSGIMLLEGGAVAKNACGTHEGQLHGLL